MCKDSKFINIVTFCSYHSLIIERSNLECYTLVEITKLLMKMAGLSHDVGQKSSGKNGNQSNHSRELCLN